MIKIAVCRKAQVREEWINKSLEEVIGEESGFESFWSADDLTRYIDTYGYEFKAYFFDNKVSGINFVELALHIREKDPMAFFVFVDYDIPKTAIISRIAPYYSFKRPFDLEYLKVLYQWVLNFQDITKNDFLVEFKGVTHRLLKEDILYFEKEKRYAYVHTTDHNEHEMIMSRYEIMDRVNSNMFAEISVSYIVNLMYVKCIEKNAVIMIDGTKINVARRRKKDLIQKVTLYDQFLHQSDQLLQVLEHD